MSTRTQLRFVQRIDSATDDGDCTTDRRIAQVYRHSDSCPERVLRYLTRLKQLLEETRAGLRGCTADLSGEPADMELYRDRDPDRCIQVTEPADLFDPANMEQLDQPMFLLGHGVENPADGIHGDEVYFYIVELLTQTSFDEPAQ